MGKLNLADIRPGDVLLYRPRKPNCIQRRICDTTKSPYTHAAIFIGNGTIAEAVARLWLIGVRKRSLKKFLKGSLCVGVLRSQMGFGHDRSNKLVSFVEDVQENKSLYNLVAVLDFKKQNANYFENQLSFIRENYGKVTPYKKFTKMSFFCSAFVVACYCVVGIIGNTAHVAYKPDCFSPAGLYRDCTFGWFLGYLVPKGGSIPIDDPLPKEATQVEPEFKCQMVVVSSEDIFQMGYWRLVRFEYKFIDDVWALVARSFSARGNRSRRRGGRRGPVSVAISLCGLKGAPGSDVRQK